MLFPTHKEKSIDEGRCKFWLYMSPNYFSYIYVGSGRFGGGGAEQAAAQGNYPRGSKYINPPLYVGD